MTTHFTWDESQLGFPLVFVLLLVLPELPALVFVLDPAVPVVVAVPPAVVDVVALVLLQYPSYQVWRACKSLAAEQLAAPHTLATLLVP